MKKNLLYLWALICSVSLLTACSSDDDNTVNDETTPPEEEAVVTAPDVVGTYWGNLDISMLPDGSDQEVVIADGLPKFITFSQVSDTEVKMELKEFELFINGNILKFGDIVIDKCAVKKGNGKLLPHGLPERKQTLRLSPDSKTLLFRGMPLLWVPVPPV